MTGIYYSLDIPAALHQQLKDYMPESDEFEFQFNLLYTVYSLPNVILPFFGGHIVDCFGAPVCLAGFAFLCWTGQLLFALGALVKSWPIMLAGRTVYGFGGESICVGYSTLLSQWFAGREVAFAFGVALAISRLGSVFNNLVSPMVADTLSTPWALSMGVVLNTISLMTTFVIWYIDDRAKRPCHSTTQTIATDSLVEPLLTDETERVYESTEQTAPAASLWDIAKFGSLFWLLSLSCLVVYGCVLPFNNVASGILLERNYFRDPPADCVLAFPDQCTSGTLSNETNPSTDANGNTCPSKGYAPVLPTSINRTGAHLLESLSASDVDCDEPFWAAGCTRDYCEAQDYASEKTGRVMSIPYFISASLSPVLGHVVDKIGQRALIASLSSILLVCVHANLALSHSSPVVPLVGQGVAYALYAAVLWPSVTLTVEKRLTGTAFGVITSIQNIGLSLFPLLIAAIYSQSGRQYIPHVELFFVACAAAGTICGIFLNILDKRKGGILNSVTSKPPANCGYSEVEVTEDIGNIVPT
jgi:MFS family permease